ncbi:MAG TPA: polyphenol oxidase family protein [Phycisphaerales bacterium]
MIAPLLSPALASLGVPHAFSTRAGGVSVPTPAADFSSLNFGNPGDLVEHRDPPGNIAVNFARLAHTIDAAGREIVQVHQMHGAAVHVVRRGAPTHATPHDTKADAVVTDDPTRLLAVRVADCCPILLTDAEGTVVAAVHAGWRGVVCESAAGDASGPARRGVLAPTVRAMLDLGARSIHAAIGPCISFDRFEVGAEVLSAFRAVFGEGCDQRRLIRVAGEGKGFVNLQACLEEQLRALGVTGVDTIARCTAGEPDLFFSHRRENGRTGRMVGVIGPRRTETA